MKKSKEQDLENYVIKSLNDFKPEEYYDFLWRSRLIGSQGPWTLDYLSDSGTISYEAQSFVQSHLDNERESDVCEAAQELYLDVIMMRAAESIREAKSGNDDYSWLLDIEDERTLVEFKELLPVDPKLKLPLTSLIPKFFEKS